MSYLSSRPVTITHKRSYVRVPSTWYACDYTHTELYTVLIHMRDVCVAQAHGTTLSEAVRIARQVVRLRRLEDVYYMASHMGAHVGEEGERRA